MTKNEKLALLEETFELDEGELNEESNLSDLENWNSMTKLSLIALMDMEFDKKLSGEQIRNFVSVNDILNFME